MENQFGSSLDGLDNNELSVRGLDPKTFLTPEECKERITEILKEEGDDELATLLLAFATLSEFRYDAVKPILERDAKFFTSLEDMGHLKFFLFSEIIYLLRDIRYWMIQKAEPLYPQPSKESYKNKNPNTIAFPSNTFAFPKDAEEPVAGVAKSLSRLQELRDEAKSELKKPKKEESRPEAPQPLLKKEVDKDDFLDSLV